MSLDDHIVRGLNVSKVNRDQAVMSRTPPCLVLTQRGNPLFVGIPYLQESPTCRNPLLAGIPYLQESPTCKNPLLAGIPYWQESPTCRNPLLAGIPYLQESPTCRNPLLAGIPYLRADGIPHMQPCHPLCAHAVGTVLIMPTSPVRVSIT